MDLLDALLGNAVKFMLDGGRIGLEINETDDSVRLVVWDTGIGIEPEKLKSVFKPFVQGDGGLSRRYDGIGLGLAYAAKMVELIGGAISVESFEVKERPAIQLYSLRLPSRYPITNAAQFFQGGPAVGVFALLRLARSGSAVPTTAILIAACVPARSKVTAITLSTTLFRHQL